MKFVLLLSILFLLPSCHFTIWKTEKFTVHAAVWVERTFDSEPSSDQIDPPLFGKQQGDGIWNTISPSEAWGTVSYKTPRTPRKPWKRRGQ